MKPPFTYFGGKLTLAERIVSLLPPHEHYVEPFAGSLAVLLAKPRSHMETVNDLDSELVAFWQVLRDRPSDLERVCALTPHSRVERAAAHESADDELEQARRTWVKLTQGRGGHTQRRSGWRYYQDPRGPHSSMPEYLTAYVSRICPAAVRMAGVSLECKPALEIIRDYGRHPQTLIFADPPYLGSLRAMNKGRQNGDSYAHEMRTDQEHRELLEALLSCRSAVVLCGYASPLYDGLLCTWSRRELPTQTGNGGSDRARVEVLWSNRPFPVAQPDLFALADDAGGAA